MKKLKRKIFLVIFFILTIFLISILCIFNFQNYNHEKTEIRNNLLRMENFRDKGQPLKNTSDLEIEDKGKQSPIFMDVIAYKIIYDNYEIIDILNYTQNDVLEDEIKQVAQKILNDKDKEMIRVGNLYFEDYSYSFQGHNSIKIIDNTIARTKLISLLKTSVIIFVLLEIAIIFVALKLTHWIIKPVIETFNKQKQFITDASHELKTPISVIMANAEILEKEPKEKKWLNNIKSESERMNKLISDLLDLAKLENGLNKQDYKVENLSKIIEITILTFESLIYENKIKFDYYIQKDIKMSCDDSQIKQLIGILLDNAIKHSEEAGEIRVNLEKEKNEIIIKVSNKGKEIPKEMQDKIFERFYRADESRNRDENRYGLGLSIAKNIVSNHNGKIMVQCENGYTIFIVKIKQS